eukprot:scaffold76807_cov66-Phaeocystis_antarctica.AAC.1
MAPRNSAARDHGKRDPCSNAGEVAALGVSASAFDAGCTVGEIGVAASAPDAGCTIAAATIPASDGLLPRPERPKACITLRAISFERSIRTVFWLAASGLTDAPRTKASGSAPRCSSRRIAASEPASAATRRGVILRSPESGSL